MRPLALAVTLAGLLAIAATVATLRPHPVGEEASTEIASREPEELVAPATPPAAVRARPVAPERVALPPVMPETLERVEEREPLSPMGRPHVPSEGPPKPTILHRPVVLAAGLFQAQGHTVALAGVEVIGHEGTCGSGEAAWSCGIHARTAFRNWLRGRALTCVVPVVPASETVVTDCMLGKQNPAEWLITQGWARAAPESSYGEFEAAARAGGKGIFGSAPAPLAPVAITLPETSGSILPETEPPPIDPSGG